MNSVVGWTELDDRAIAYARALAADAVQKVGNGHPGTAMSLAPVAYLLFQRHLPCKFHPVKFLDWGMLGNHIKLRNGIQNQQCLIKMDGIQFLI